MSAQQQPRILHVITALNHGGAEAMLAKLLAADHLRQEFAHDVISLLRPGIVGRSLILAGHNVRSLRMRRGIPDPLAMFRLAGHIGRLEPDLIMGWMYHGNIAATIGRALARTQAPLLWNIRHSVNDIRNESLMSSISIRASALLSARPDAIVFNSETARGEHGLLGFRGTSSTVIGNGFDIDAFAPDDEARSQRQALSADLGIAPCATIVAMVARLHPMKNHAGLVDAVAAVRQAGHDIHLIMAGFGTDDPASDLAAHIARTLPPDRVTLMGDRRDVSNWLRGVDIVVIPSLWGEGFPNVLGEAMASGVACLATDVGDSRLVLGEGGLCIAPDDAAALCEALTTLCAAGPGKRRALGKAGRARIEAHYAMPRIVRSYAELFRRQLALPTITGPAVVQRPSQCVG